MNAIEDLARLIKKLPGMGEKSSLRLCYHLLKTDPSFNKALGERIISLQEKIHPCPICGSYTEEDICEYCSSPRRDHTQLMALSGIGPDKLRIRELIDRIENGDFKEIIIATNPTEEGDTTALYIKRILEGKDLTITRLASGLPIGGDLGYADKTTLMRSLKSRIKI